MTRAKRLLMAMPLTAALLAPPSFVPPAGAQERPRNLLEMLFGGPRQTARPQRPSIQEPRQTAPRKVRRKRSVSPSPKSSTARASVAAAPAVTPVTKAETAKNVLVIGDFMAGSLAKGLADAFAESRDIRVTDSVNGSSGLVRDDHYAWLTELGPIIEREKPDVVVVMLGANDRQTIRVGGAGLPLRSDAWAAEYTRRVEAIAALVREKNARLVWVGMPAFQADKASEDMVYFNDLYRTAALRVGGEYVDVWGGFTDANGSYASSGPDLAGQTARLRNSDGITLTSAGQEKLAYFAEKPITKILGLNVDDLVAHLGTQQLSASQLPATANPLNATETPPISFSNPRFDGGDQLLGAGPTALAAGDTSLRNQLVVKGSSVAAIEGRADHFNWTGRGGAVSPTTHENAIVARGTVSLDELRRAIPDPSSPEKPQLKAPEAASDNTAPHL